MDMKEQGEQVKNYSGGGTSLQNDEESIRPFPGIVTEKGSTNTILFQTLENLAEIRPDEVQKIAASQIIILSSYYIEALKQAKKSFNWGLVAAGVGLFFFLGAIGVLLLDKSQSIATISAVSGAVVEFISAINFYLYGTTTKQLSDFHERLDRTQRFLLANSICESIEGDERQKARAQLVQAIATTSESKSDSGPISK